MAISKQAFTPIQLQKLQLPDYCRLVKNDPIKYRVARFSGNPILATKRVAPVGKYRFASVRVKNILPVLFRYLKVFPIERFF